MFKEQEKRIFQLLEEITNLEQFQDNTSVHLNIDKESEKNNITSIEIKSYFDGGRYIELILKRDGYMHTYTTFSCMKDYDDKFKYHGIQDNIKMGDEWGKLNYHTIERNAFPFLYHSAKTNPFTDSVTFLVNEDGVTERIKLDDYNYRYNDLPFEIEKQQNKLVNDKEVSHILNLEDDTCYIEDGDKKISFEEEKQRLRRENEQYASATSAVYADITDTEIRETVRKTRILVSNSLAKSIERLEKEERAFRYANELMKKRDNNKCNWYSESELAAVADKMESYLESEKTYKKNR